MTGLSTQLAVLWCVIAASVQDQGIGKAIVKKDLAVRQNAIGNGTDFGSNHKLLTINEWLDGLFDHFAWNGDSYRNVNEKCSNELRSYLEHLRNGSTWAAKSEYHTALIL